MPSSDAGTGAWRCPLLTRHIVPGSALLGTVLCWAAPGQPPSPAGERGGYFVFADDTFLGALEDDSYSLAYLEH